MFQTAPLSLQCDRRQGGAFPLGARCKHPLEVPEDLAFPLRDGFVTGSTVPVVTSVGKEGRARGQNKEAPAKPLPSVSRHAGGFTSRKDGHGPCRIYGRPWVRCC